MIEKVKDIINRRDNNKEYDNNTTKVNKKEVPNNIKQIRCPTCFHIHVFLNQEEITCCNITYFRPN